MIPIKQLEAGRFFEVKQGHEIHFFRLLKMEPVILVAAYWPIFDTTEKTELKSNCTEFPFDESTKVIAGEYAPINDEDLEAICTFERIREAKTQRLTAFKDLLFQAKKAMQLQHWNLAIDLLNEAAPYNKLDTTLYKLRGLCQLYSGNTLLAKADLGFYLEMGEDAEIRQIWENL
jgi:hypothetical protein